MLRHDYRGSGVAGAQHQAECCALRLHGSDQTLAGRLASFSPMVPSPAIGIPMGTRPWRWCIMFPIFQVSFAGAGTAAA
jgi:hypothetical protein